MFGIPLSWIAAGILALAVGGYVWHCEATKRDHAQLVARLEEQAKAQEIANAKEALRQAKNKERTDEEQNRRLADLRRANKRLRDELADTVFVPPAAPGSASSDLACFDREQLNGALRAFAAGVQGLIEEGGEAVIGLDAAKGWARGL